MFAKQSGPGLKDIAEKAGLAIPTVSLILNGRSNNYISAKTRERVLAIARELKYRPRFSGKLISGQRTRTAAIVLTQAIHIAEPHLQELVLNLIGRLEGMEYAAYVATLGRDPIAQLGNLADRGCEAFVLIGRMDDAEAATELFRQRRLSYIGYNSNLDRSVDSETPVGVAALLRHFLDCGRTDFKMFLLAEAEGFAPNSRSAALLHLFPDDADAALRSDRILFMADAGADAPSRFEAGFAATHTLVSSVPRPGALFYHTDHHALGGIKALSEAGLRVGTDVLVAGYNNIEAMRWLPFPASSAAPDLERLAPALLSELLGEGPCRRRIEPKVFLR
ncbi:MAG: LacI family DNA-binding transcriptional regulator [Spirochaetes bacterium]|nr:LacI family DNA-binding transcriptional regulator [Spirochaetota bacterium]